jgi:hypothetical protein
MFEPLANLGSSNRSAGALREERVAWFEVGRGEEAVVREARELASMWTVPLLWRPDFSVIKEAGGILVSGSGE